MNTGAILVVDDETQIHRFLKPALEAAGYATLRAETGAEALRLAASASPDLVLLDLGLPDMDGHEVLTKLREFSAIPVIVLSARDREAEKIAALDAGAHDYVEKPFALGELLARMRSALRMHAQQADAAPHLGIGPLALDPERRAASLHQKDGTHADLGLTRIQYTLLALLVRNQGRVLTHRQILTAVWGPAHTEDIAYLRIYVSQLRRKLAGSGISLATEPGVGYRLIETD
ncbi:response regulator [Acidiphilium sp. AL]|uniref:Response regulator n=1 Tax=Acidiphilium iwatense TaxID=768198 RepID=A0ABS9DUU1_9PROT|nr:MULTISPECIES: response regulator [Acidiphilium]MCF3946508.1 response regulator [Acidiphilium iwatense]MCU4160409.1 response regulator [Acidiphilium sp. AL]